jgi:hypothetical protein
MRFLVIDKCDILFSKANNLINEALLSLARGNSEGGDSSAVVIPFQVGRPTCLAEISNCRVSMSEGGIEIR